MIKPRKNLDIKEEMKSNDWRYLVYETGQKTLSLCVKQHRIMDVFLEERCKIKVGDIYLGRVTRIVKNIDAAFLELGNDQSCFLPLADVKEPLLTNRKYDGQIKESDQLVIQIKKEAYKSKMAVASTKLEIVGDYCVVSNQNNSMSFSKKTTPEQRESMRLEIEKYPELLHYNGSILLRTKACDAKHHKNAIQEALNHTAQMLEMTENVIHRPKIGLIYEAEGLYHDLIRRCNNDGGIIYTQAQSQYEQLKKVANELQLDCDGMIRLYNDESISMNALFGVGNMIKEITSEKVWMKSGGNLYITPTEALTVIDVNTAKSQGKEKREETFLAINLEAATQIAYQIRARNLSGMIIVDFINMYDEKSITILLEAFKKALSCINPPGILVDVTKLGLIEITRKKETTDIYQKMTSIDKTILL